MRHFVALADNAAALIVLDLATFNDKARVEDRDAVSSFRVVDVAVLNPEFVFLVRFVVQCLNF